MEGHRCAERSSASSYAKNGRPSIPPERFLRALLLAELAYLGHVLKENRNGLMVDTRLTHATGKAEREAAMGMRRLLESPACSFDRKT